MPQNDVAAIADAVQAAARRFDGALRTPLIASAAIGAALGVDLHFKAENFQHTGSFKFRGALNRLLSLPVEVGKRGIITASSGNHGIACATAAKRSGYPVTVVLPENAAPNKRAKIAAMGAEIVIHGAESGAAERHARSLGAARGLFYVSPYNDPEIIAGQGTVGLEILDELAAFDCVFVAMGGGGLIGGIGAILKTLRPACRIIGVSAENSPALEIALREGHVRPVTHLETLADGVAGDMEADSITFPLCQAVVDEVVACTEAEIAEAFCRMAYEEHQIVEGSAALALAGLIKLAPRLAGQRAVVILCGANIVAGKVRALLTGFERAAPDRSAG